MKLSDYFPLIMTFVLSFVLVIMAYVYEPDAVNVLKAMSVIAILSTVIGNFVSFVEESIGYITFSVFFIEQKMQRNRTLPAEQREEIQIPERDGLLHDLRICIVACIFTIGLYIV